MKRLALLISLALVALNAPAQKMPDGAKAPDEPELTLVKKAAEKYRDVKVALAEGFLRDPMDMCDTAPMMGRPAELGAMGIHYFRPDLLGITGTSPRVNGNGTHTDFLQPAILIYEPQADGSLELVAVENLVFKRAWHEKNAEVPSYYGVPWDSMQDDPATEIDEAHHFEPHYDRHVWLFRDNPNGIFSPFNPNVSCANHKTGAPAKMTGTMEH
jgi:hypothetical protein